MKNKLPDKNNFFKTKGFYVALYSCITVVLVFAAGLSFYNISTVTKKPTTPNARTPLELEQTLNNEARSYLTPDDRTALDNIADAGSMAVLPSQWQALQQQTVTSQTNPGAANPSTTGNPTTGSPATNPTGTANPAGTTNPAATARPGVTTNPAANPGAANPAATNSVTNPAASANPATNPASTTNPTATKPPTATAAPRTGTSGDAKSELTNTQAFKPFGEGMKMTWPVVGEVLMDFSTEALVYDTTLDQFRTNDNICIAAPVGTQVRAGAEGIVIDIGTTRENGKYIVLDNGAGWMTTYSQLQDSVLVKKGEHVKAGQTIGGVASPTAYSILMGPHLTFKVAKNTEVINPITVLAK